MKLRIASILGAGVFVLLACRKAAPSSVAEVSKEPEVAVGGVTVRDIQLGNALGDDRNVAMPVTTFDAQDTIYVAITTGAASDSTPLVARWLFDREGAAELIDSTAQTLLPGGPSTTEFHISNSGGWPAGNYRVEVFAKDKPVATRDFEIR